MASPVTGPHAGIRFRAIELPGGQRFQVPQGIQRIDHRATHGWQLRYGQGTRLFSDGDAEGAGAAAALKSATRELLRRIAQEPAPSMLQKTPSRNKKSGLPAGVSGPVVRQRASGSVRDCSFTVLLPRFGLKPQRRTVYIGTENTYSRERHDAALARALALREAAVRAYERAATAAKRQAARELKRSLQQGAREPAKPGGK
jgi:hypothetical protein